MQESSIFEAMVKAWGNPIVPRCKVGEFSGGLLNPRTLANLDCLGTGPEGPIRIGSKIVYRTEELARWLEGRSSKN
jgi:hypothetical protein